MRSFVVNEWQGGFYICGFDDCVLRPPLLQCVFFREEAWNLDAEPLCCIDHVLPIAGWGYHMKRGAQGNKTRTHARTYRTGKAENLRMQTLASAPAHLHLISCNQLLEVHVVAPLDGFALLVLWYGVKKRHEQHSAPHTKLHMTLGY